MPVRSENDSFGAVFVVAALVAAGLALGYWIAPWLGGVLAAFALAALVAWMLMDRSRQAALRAADAAGARGARARRTLLIANEAPTLEQFRRDILPLLRSRPTLEIHAPVLQSRTHFVTTDIDHERSLARRRLEQLLAVARDEGIAASGDVGDPIDPLAGVADELRRVEADEVIVTTGAGPRANWVESELLEQLNAALDRPVTQIVIDREDRPLASA
jgi:hypothetical protein